MVSLESCDGLTRHRSQLSVNRAGIVTVPLQLCLHLNNYLVRGQVAVTVDRSVVRIVRIRIVTPCWIPVTRVPVPPIATYKDDAAVIVAPPSAIMPLSVVIPKRSILLSAKLAASPVVGNGHISVPVDPNVRGGVAGDSPVTEVSITIDRHVTSDAGLIAEPRTAISNARARHIVGTNCCVTANTRCRGVGPLPERRSGNAPL